MHVQNSFVGFTNGLQHTAACGNSFKWQGFFKQNVVLISDQSDVTILILGTVVIAAQ